jgi:hypothetical protein
MNFAINWLLSNWIPVTLGALVGLIVTMASLCMCALLGAKMADTHWKSKIKTDELWNQHQ